MFVIIVKSGEKFLLDSRLKIPHLYLYLFVFQNNNNVLNIPDAGGGGDAGAAMAANQLLEAGEGEGQAGAELALPPQQPVNQPVQAPPIIDAALQQGMCLLSPCDDAPPLLSFFNIPMVYSYRGKLESYRMGSCCRGTDVGKGEG